MKAMNTNGSTLMISLAAAALIAGCASEYPRADADWGKSVRQMVQKQTYDPVAAANPPEHAPEEGDGQRIENAIEVYRKDVAKGGDEVRQPIVFDVGE